MSFPIRIFEFGNHVFITVDADDRERDRDTIFQYRVESNGNVGLQYVDWYRELTERDAVKYAIEHLFMELDGSNLKANRKTFVALELAGNAIIDQEFFDIDNFFNKDQL